MRKKFVDLAEKIREAIKISELDISDAHLDSFLKEAETCGSCWNIGCKDGCSGGCLSACKSGKK